MLDSPISSGREGKKTPPGEFKAGPTKSRMHRSRLYHNAPMPWSVQVHENIFIHGFRKVPRRPSSHGCIRLPLTGANPAKWFYNWIDIGTPIGIKGHWPAANAVPVEESAPTARPFVHKVVIVVVTAIACVMVILLVWRSRGRNRGCPRIPCAGRRNRRARGAQRAGLIAPPSRHACAWSRRPRRDIR